MRDALKVVCSSSFNIRSDCCTNEVLTILRVNIDQNFCVCFGVGAILTCFLTSLCSRVSASSGNAAEGVAPPRGGDRNILKPFVIPQTQTGPLASSQPPHRAPIHTDVRQQRSGSPNGSETFGKSNQPLWDTARRAMKN